MWLTTASSFVAFVVIFVAIHVVVTYLASERLNVFTALCMLSMLPALALGTLGVVVTHWLMPGWAVARVIGFAVFALLVLPYTAQGLWEIVTRRTHASTPSPEARVDAARTSEQPASPRFDLDELIEKES